MELSIKQISEIHNVAKSTIYNSIRRNCVPTKKGRVDGLIVQLIDEKYINVIIRRPVLPPRIIKVVENYYFFQSKMNYINIDTSDYESKTIDTNQASA